MLNYHLELLLGEEKESRRVRWLFIQRFFFKTIFTSYKIYRIFVLMAQDKSVQKNR